MSSEEVALDVEGTCSNDFHRQKKGRAPPQSLLWATLQPHPSSWEIPQKPWLKMAYETEWRWILKLMFKNHWQRETNPGFGTMMIDFQTSSTTSINSKCKLRTTHPWSSPHKSGVTWDFGCKIPNFNPTFSLKKGLLLCLPFIPHLPAAEDRKSLNITGAWPCLPLDDPKIWQNKSGYCLLLRSFCFLQWGFPHKNKKLSSLHDFSIHSLLFYVRFFVWHTTPGNMTITPLRKVFRWSHAWWSMGINIYIYIHMCAISEISIWQGSCVVVGLNGVLFFLDCCAIQVLTLTYLGLFLSEYSPEV